MTSFCAKILLWFVSLTVAVELIQGASQCPRTNTKPAQNCAKECLVGTGCSHHRKKCICDGDCGYSCINPNRKCSKPSVRNGKVIYKSSRFNDTQRTICKPGFKLTGSATRRCRGNGLWDGKRSRCRKPKKLCKDPGTPGSTMRFRPASPNGFNPGTILQYYCPPKYILKGSQSLRCESTGKWTDNVPTCHEPKCNAAVLPPNSYVIRPKNWRNLKDYGVRFTLGCNPGYTTTQRGNLVCVTPNWKLGPSSFKCFPKSCPDPGIPRNGDRKGLFVFGEKVYFKCDKCFKLNGPIYRQCQANQRWSDTQPTCDPASCGRIKSPVNGRVIVTSRQCGGRASYRCNHGYRLDGPRSRACQSDGTWSEKEPKCLDRRLVKPTKPFKTTQNIGLKTTMLTIRSTTTNIPTTKKLLTTTTVKIQSPCGQPSLRPEAKIALQKGKYLFIGCQAHYSLVSRGIMICRNKKWTTHGQLKCIRKGCSNPGVPRNGLKHGLSYFYDDVVKFSCDACYSIVGHSQRKCLKNGTWSDSQPKCVLKTCSPLKNTTTATVYFTSTNCGDTATYQCKIRHQVVLGSGMRTCSENQDWTGGEPQCIGRNLNIALGKPTEQSSEDPKWKGPSSKAVDGNKDTRYFRGASCTHTRNQWNPWWRVDLRKEEPVAQVIVVNRGDCCCDRLDNFEVTVGNDLNHRKNAKCGKYGRTKPGETIKIVCPPNLRGRYVGIIHNRWTILTLCEVEVYRRLT